MEGFVKVGRLSDFEPGVVREVQAGAEPIAVVNAGGELHAISDFCPHEGISFSAGYGAVFERRVVCMMHSSMFDLDSGEVLVGPSETGLSKYEVRIEGEDVYVAKEASVT